jgi:maleate isomerase
VQEDIIHKRIGVLSPQAVVDNTPYDFYRIAPDGVILLVLPLGIRGFSREEVERVFAPLDEQLDALMLRRIDLTQQAGVPLQLALGVDAHDRRIAYIEKRTGKPATSSVLGAVAAAKRLGIRNIALVNKFSDDMNATLREFFTRDGVAVAGVSSWEKHRKAMTPPSEYMQMSRQENLDIGRDLCSRALAKFPDADGIYIGGGSWRLTPLVRGMEAEFGVPVVAHQDAMIWDVLTRVSMWRPKPGYGRLLSGE